MPDFNEFLVETMVQSVVCELIVGVHRDPTFGLALTVGAGGTLVELVDDSVTLLFPAHRDEIRAAIETLKVYDLIAGHRGNAAGDIESTLDAIEAIARYADLTGEEDKTLVEEDKWLAALGAAIHGEMDRISQTLTQRVKELAERYETPLPEAVSQVAELEQAVSRHLERMGFSW